MPLGERDRVGGFTYRAVAILPGIVILGEIMVLFGLDAFEVSEHDILRRAALRYGAS